MALVALVRPPTASLHEGLRTHVARAPIDFPLALDQHLKYTWALREAGADLRVLPSAEQHPDAVFVEDTALVLDSLAVMAHSAAASRRGETPVVAATLSQFCYLAHPPPGACFDAGDALVIGRTVYLGRSERTNQTAVDFLRRLLRQYYYETVEVPVWGCLHLKTAVSYLGENTVLINPEWVPREAFRKYEQITVERTEPLAANALLVGQRLFMSSTYGATLGAVMKRGFKPQAIDIGEFHKAEGGLTCLSILLETPSG